LPQIGRKAKYQQLGELAMGSWLAGDSWVLGDQQLLF